MCFTVHSSLAQCCPLCTLKTFYFSVFCLMWELHFKSLTNLFVCWRRLGFCRCRSEVCCVSMQFCGTVSPLRSGVPTVGLRALTPTPAKRRNHPLINQSIICNRPVIFCMRSDQKRVSSPKTNIWFQVSVLLNHVCVFPQQRVFAVSFPAVLHQMPWFFNKSYKMQRCWPFKQDSQIFFLHGSFCMKKKEACSIHKSDKKLVFHYPLPKEFVICNHSHLLYFCEYHVSHKCTSS